MIVLIAAVARHGAIGRKGDLLWHLPEDLRHFKRVTSGSCVVMGRKTWESLPKRPLPGRRNIVVTRNADYVAEGAEVLTSLKDALQAARATASCGEGNTREKMVFIIGGGELYAASMPYADRLELTEIDAEAADADTFFPEVDKDIWELTKVEEAETESEIPYRFCTYESRKRRCE